ncbi:hypothetical protein M9H77_01015 [Catharanthus roseus]|uniref:Uncharacterized protein n=1 Tax=Catharanthus roseus TaxID=4058 RepID=A0ACC0C4S8_CATRO|nr:hypothetical protein M9H77_01015 [Catharanthus roseus]
MIIVTNAFCVSNLLFLQKQDHLLVKARQSQEILSKNARFEQIWRSRRENIVHDEAVGEMCQLYNVVRVDVDEKSNDVRKDRFPELDGDCKMMAEYLPLLREVLPSAAAEVEADILDHMSGASLDSYVYDYYAVNDDMDNGEENAASHFPLVQVEEDDDYYDGPDDCEYESDDSNAENNPLNDYPDEESSDLEDMGSSHTDTETRSKRADDSSNEDESSASEGSFVLEEGQERDWSDNADFLCGDDIYSDDDFGRDEMYDEDDFGDEDWR